MQDTLELLRYAKQMDHKNGFAGQEGESFLKIAVVGSFSTQHFVMALKAFLWKNHIFCDIYEGEFNGINSELLNLESGLFKFQPEYVIILTHYTDIIGYPNILSDAKAVEEWINERMAYFNKIWGNLKQMTNCTVLQTNFVIPMERELGNLEANCHASKTNCLKLLNIALTERHPDFIFIVDLDYIASTVGKLNWFDYSGYFLNKEGFQIRYLGQVATEFGKLILIKNGGLKKCLILDLDNTLWGGEVGDAGCDGIILDPNTAEGEAYRYFQQYIKNLKERGVILAVCSKNDLDHAKAPFLKNEFMILKLEDISCFIANWRDKASNIKQISLDLNIGLESMVFFDDSKVERELVKNYLPEVEVIDVPDSVEDYVKTLDGENVFTWFQVSEEDLERSKSYIDNIKREELKTQFDDYDEFLRSLDMKVNIELTNPKQLKRFIQLVNKTNQFNLRTIRYTEAEVNALMEDKNCCLLSISLKDRFTNYGIISCIILKIENKSCFIDTWVMSCRVLKRNIEHAAMNRIEDIAKQKGCKTITAEYIPTEKNKMVRSLYSDFGFQEMEGTGNKIMFCKEISDRE